jgi:hypothetical protein
MELLLGDEHVWLAILEYWLKRAITFDATAILRSNFYNSYLRIFSSG